MSIIHGPTLDQGVLLANKCYSSNSLMACINSSVSIPIMVGNGAYRFGRRMQGMQVMKKLCHLKHVLWRRKSLTVNITLDIKSLLFEMKISCLSSSKHENIFKISCKSNCWNRADPTKTSSWSCMILSFDINYFIYKRFAQIYSA